MLVSSAFICLIATSQSYFIQYYRVEQRNSDTVAHGGIVNKQGKYIFYFPETVFTRYIIRDTNTLALDTIIERHKREYGPFIFKKRRNKIVFKPDGARHFSDLYNIDSKDFLTTDFLSGSNSYSIPAKLLDANFEVVIKNYKIACYKYMLTMKYDNYVEYLLLYLDKKNLLPILYQYYSDNNFTLKTREIFGLYERVN